MYAWPKPTREGVLTTYPEAIDAGLFEPAVTSPEAPVSLGEQRAIRAWLGHRRDRPGQVLNQCRCDGEAGRYY